MLRGASRAVIRAAQKYLAGENRKHSVSMVAVPRAAWPSAFDQSGIPVVGCWRSRSFLAVAYEEKPPAIRLSIQRTFVRDDGNWQDGITWDELQRIKNECGFSDRDAIEVYPRAADVVNVANLRHLWVLAEPFALTWRGQS